ncbi:zinc transporter ZIP5 [Rhea pennata]|uniref:zinc transporter ZIP5 n=1 Tax=Rhea pennata TaxID=8795 RepID=UPI002E26C2FB
MGPRGRLLACLWLLALPGARGAPGGLLALPEDAAQEHGYYLRQLFGQYGANGTLPFEGLARLLLSLGLGRVQVVQIQHEELGHGHVSHLDLLEVQEDKHRHRHPAWEHGGAEASAPPPTAAPAAWGRPARYPGPGASPSFPGHRPARPVAPEPPAVLEPPWSKQGVKIWREPAPSEPPGSRATPGSRGDPSAPWRDQPSLSLLGRVLGLDHSVYGHPHEDCLNVTQLLLNFGLASVARLTPEQFSLLCPALLYQIDSRVCIQHSDEVTPPPPGGALWPALGWGLLAVALLSLPSALAVLLVPLLSRGAFRSLLSFLVALAAGTLCGDALLHLWPHAQGRHAETPAQLGAAELRQGLAVLGGIYLLFLTELLLGMLRRRREAAVRAGRAPRRARGPQDPAACPMPGSALLQQRRAASSCPPRETPCSAAPAPGAELRRLTAPELELGLPGAAEPHGHPHGDPHGHSHGPMLPSRPGATDFVWMVVLGDGIHNLMDGLAIGTAFSHSLSGGLSTALAVLCHELPHELGDLAVLLQSGASPRAVLLLNLLSALLSCLGAAAGAAVGQGASHLAPGLLAAAAGLFLYVALADMLPEVLRGAEAAAGGSWGRFALQNGGFLLGSGIMLGIALLEGRVSALLQP